MVFLFTMRGIQLLHLQNALRITAHSVKNLFLIHCENIFIIFCVCFSGSSFFLCTALFFFLQIQIFYPILSLSSIHSSYTFFYLSSLYNSMYGDTKGVTKNKGRSYNRSYKMKR